MDIGFSEKFAGDICVSDMFLDLVILMSFTFNPIFQRLGVANWQLGLCPRNVILVAAEFYFRRAFPRLNRQSMVPIAVHSLVLGSGFAPQFAERGDSSLA